MARKIKLGRDEVIGVIDVGSQKVCCLVLDARRQGPQHSARAPHLLGVGIRRAEGVRAGTVTGLDAAEASIRAAVAEAERAAGVDISRVIVPVACGRLTSRTFTASTPLAGATVRQSDIERIAEAADGLGPGDDRALVHLDWAPFRLDSLHDIDDPIGMAGRTLTARLLAITADRTALGNLTIAVERAQLDVVRTVPAALASALATTTPMERRDGALVIDVGAGATKFALMGSGRLLHASGLAIGGRSVTDAIAREFGIEHATAERIKVLCGTLLQTAVENTDHTGMHGGDGQKTSFGGIATGRVDNVALARVVAQGIEQWVELVAERLHEIERASRRDDGRESVGPVPPVVLTGGGALLEELADALSLQAARPVRIGTPIAIEGPSSEPGEPMFATAIGAMAVPRGPAASGGRVASCSSGGGGLVSRMAGWMRESF